MQIQAKIDSSRNELTPNPAFQLIRHQAIAALNCEFAEYRHVSTGAVHYHLANGMDEKVFMVGLRTVPEDSTGVAHMLEHTVLCGSEKFPVRDPFFMMLRRSLNTFMNAFTSSDWTAYPFATLNQKDFYNLLDVYLDAVFFSRLDPRDFSQEGHRLDFATPGDTESELVFKGVVYNEMKGAMSSAVSVLWQRLCQHLYPTTTYHYNSGGDPASITHLTYEGLKSFYQKHYHPSNAVFMTSGDLNVAEVQGVIEQNALVRFQRSDDRIRVAPEHRYAEPQRVVEPYESDEESAKTHLVMGWLLGDSSELLGQLEAHLLSNILMGDSAAPLRHWLETTELGSSPSPLCGLEDSNREMCFVCGLEGSEPEQAEAFEQQLLALLEQLAEKGIEHSRVESVLHQLELNQREVRGDGYPYGLQLMLSALPAAVHGGDPLAILDLDPVLVELRQRISNKDYVPGLIRRLLLQNNHRVRLSLVPDTSLAENNAEAEKARLAAIKQTMSEEQLVELLKRNELLAERQKQKDDISILPKVGVEDIPEEIHIPAGQTKIAKGKDVHWYAQGTNGLVYQMAVFDLPALTPEQQRLLPLYTSFIPELGCAGKSYLEVQAWQTAVSGGISAGTRIQGAIDDEQNVQGVLTIGSKGLARNHQAMTDLLFSTLSQLRFDELNRMADLIAQRRASADAHITDQGHSYAVKAAMSQLSPVAAYTEQVRGLTAIQALRQLDAQLAEPDQRQFLADQLQALHQKLMSARCEFLLIGEEEQAGTYLTELDSGWSQWPKESMQDPFTLPTTRSLVQQAWTLNTQVNFCARAYATVPGDHPDAAALNVLGEYLRNGYLHGHVREQGGAYGSGAGQDNQNAAFKFYSYRDPRLEETLNDFEASIDWLLNNSHQDSQLEEAILGVIGAFDKPSSPAGEARQAYFNQRFGRTPQYLRGLRSAILDVTLADLCRVAETYLSGHEASTVVLAPAKRVDSLEPLHGFQRFKL